MLAKHVFLGPTHLRCDLFDDFLLLWICFFSLGLFFSWAGWISHFFKDLEAETIHVCIAWALLKYLGLFFFVFYCWFAHLFLSWFLYIGLGMVDTRYSLLPASGWSGCETMGCGVVFHLRSISWGSLAGWASHRPYALKMAFWFFYPSLLVFALNSNSRGVTLYDLFISCTLSFQMHLFCSYSQLSFS